MLIIFILLSFLTFIFCLYNICSNDTNHKKTVSTNDSMENNNIIIFSKMSSDYFDIYSPKNVEEFRLLSIDTDWCYGDHAIYPECYPDIIFDKEKYIILKPKSNEHDSYLLDIKENFCWGAYSKSQSEYGVVTDEDEKKNLKNLLDIDPSLKKVLQIKYNEISETYIYNSNDPNLIIDLSNNNISSYSLGLKTRYILDGINIDLLESKELLENEVFKNFLNKIEKMTSLNISCEIDSNFDLNLQNLKYVGLINVNGCNKIRTVNLPNLDIACGLDLQKIETVNLPILSRINNLRLSNIETVNLLNLRFLKRGKINCIRYFNAPELRAIADRDEFFCFLDKENINAPKLVYRFLFDDNDEKKLEEKYQRIEKEHQKEMDRMR